MSSNRRLSVSEATQSLVDLDHMSKEVARKLNQRDDSVPVSELELSIYEPALLVFVIDASQSMSLLGENPTQEDLRRSEEFIRSVIESQHVAIDTLRASHLCANGALWVAQVLFSTQPVILNTFRKLHPDRNDDVPLLDELTYRPQDGGQTALYATMLGVLQRIAVHIADGLAREVRATASIALITDGEDNIGGVSPADIRAILSAMKEKGDIRSSLVIGIANKDLPKARIEHIREDLGFDKSVSVEQTPQEIRRAFVLGSKVSLGAFN